MYGDEDAKCQLCKVETETLEHLLLDCTELSNIRNPILRCKQTNPRFLTNVATSGDIAHEYFGWFLK